MEKCPKASSRCPEAAKKLGCRTVSHHIFWPGKDYSTRLERDFRGLERNRVTMCVAEEQELHNTTPPPPKPTVEVMRFCVEQEQLRRRLQI